MNILFAGTPPFAAAALAALLDAGQHVTAVLTQPDRPAGRGRAMRTSSVKQLARSAGLPVLQPPSLREPAVQRALAAFDADVMVVAAYGLILPPPVLALPRFGCINIHASLLPRWRGAAPIQRALLAGDTQTGISIMQMDAGLDTGPVLLQAPLAIDADDSAGAVHDKLAELGGRCVLQALIALGAAPSIAQPQDETRACYAAKIDNAEARIEWRCSAPSIARQVRAFDPVPGAFGTYAGTALKIWKAHTVSASGAEPGVVIDVQRDAFVVACGDGALRIEEVQRAGAKRLRAAQFLAGSALRAGDRFDLEPR